MDGARCRDARLLGLVVTVEAAIAGDACRKLRISAAGDAIPELALDASRGRVCWRSAQAPPSGERSSGMSSPTSQRLASSPRNGERRARFLLETGCVPVIALDELALLREAGVRCTRVDAVVTLPEPVTPPASSCGEAPRAADKRGSSNFTGVRGPTVCVRPSPSPSASRRFRGLERCESPVNPRFVSRRSNC